METINDLSEIFTKENSDNGVWKQVVMFGKPWNVEVKIIGTDSDIVQNFVREKTKEMKKHISLKSGNELDIDDEFMNDAYNTGIENALVSFAGIRKLDGKALSLDGVEIPIEKTKDCEKVYKNILVGSPDIKEFIVRESSKRSNFLSTGKKN